jgi:hypothetical protein
MTPLSSAATVSSQHHCQIFTFDDVFEERKQETSMNFDEMSNCLINLMDHSSINGNDNGGNGGSGFKQCDNNYDSAINYIEHNEQQQLSLAQYFT